ncbi:MAG: phosphate ABC transporter permease subunit PstC [Solirubrobacteraceae bacterium]|nr:phosphate ABC transporter permease subunit PstC [Solirubrobacteraceae bacterium]
MGISQGGEAAATAGAARVRAVLAVKPRWGERAVRGSLVLCALLSVATTVAIVVALLEPTIAFFRHVSPIEFLTTTEWAPLFSDPAFGVLPLLSATLVLTAIALCVALPFGLGSAIYLSEYASPRTRGLVKPTLEVLAGIPTVVFGFFALTFLTPLLQDVWFLPGDPPGVFNALSAGLVMGVMIIPTVASLAEDAMAAVPHDMRAGSFALGATKLSTTVRVVVPAALSGIVAAFILGVSRAIGETMIVTIASGGTPNLSFDPAEAMQTMTAFIAAAGIGDQPTGSVGYQTIFAVGTTLFAITFLMNMLSVRIVRRYREVYE